MLTVLLQNTALFLDAVLDKTDANDTDSLAPVGIALYAYTQQSQKAANAHLKSKQLLSLALNNTVIFTHFIYNL